MKLCYPMFLSIQVRKSRVLEPEDVESFTIKQGTQDREIKKGEKTEKVFFG